MKNLFLIVSCIICLALSVSGAIAGEAAPAKVVNLANSTLANLGKDLTVIKAVQQQNAQGKSLDEIKTMDEKWKATPGIADYMKAIMESECGQHLRQVQESTAYYAEIFVMDNQGANVAMTDKTSDYWQGDEAKFQKSFNGGNGAVFVDEIEFDDSSQAYLVQVSVPVMDGGKAIGAITFGIDVDRIE